MDAVSKVCWTDDECTARMRAELASNGGLLMKAVKSVGTSCARASRLLGIVPKEKKPPKPDPRRVKRCQCGLSIWAGESDTHVCIYNKNIYDLSADRGGAHEVPRGWKVL